MTNLGLAYWLQGEQVNAFEAMGQALRETPSDSTYYHTAYFHHTNGLQNKASEYFKKSYELNPDILENRAWTVTSTPATSPTRKFYSDELAIAELYITTGSTPSEVAHSNRPPTLGITNLTLDPNPVMVNKPFDFHINFKLDVPSSSKRTLPAILKFTVLRGEKLLFSSESYPIETTNSETEKYSLHMKPVPAKGTYTIKVIVSHHDVVSEKSIELLIN